MPAPTTVLLPLNRPAVFRLVLWSALYGLFVGIVLAAVVTLVSGASAETGQALRLAGPAGMLVGGVLARVRAPAVGILVDGDGIELHGFWRTRRLAWASIDAIGWMTPGHRLAVRTTGGAVKAGAGKLPRRVPAELVRIAAAHGVDVVVAAPLTAPASKSA